MNNVTTTTTTDGVLLFDGTRLTQQNVAIATTQQVGVVKPDGVNITIDAAGTITTQREATGYDAIYVQLPITGTGTPSAPISISIGNGIALDINKAISIDSSYSGFTNYYTKDQVDTTFAKKTDIPLSLSVPVATKKDIGGIIVGDSLTIDDGVLNVIDKSIINKVMVYTKDISVVDGVYSTVINGTDLPVGVITSKSHFFYVDKDDYHITNTEDEQSTTLVLNRFMLIDDASNIGTWTILTYKG